MADNAESSDASKRRRIDPALLKWMRFFFYAAHFVVPLAALALIGGYIVGNLGCHRFDLSWQLLVVVAVALLPFLLPLAVAYVGKVGPVEMNDGFPQEQIILRATAPGEQAAVPAGEAALAAHHGPNFDALTEDEKSVLKTLWTYQLKHTAGGGAGWWGFSVPPDSPTYKNFVRGSESLSERKLIGINKGLVFLNDKGLAYCNLNEEKLVQIKSYWTIFKPAS